MNFISLFLDSYRLFRLSPLFYDPTPASQSIHQPLTPVQLRRRLRKTMEFERITREEPSQRAIWKYLSPVLYQAKRVPTFFISKADVLTPFTLTIIQFLSFL